MKTLWGASFGTDCWLVMRLLYCLDRKQYVTPYDWDEKGQMREHFLAMKKCTHASRKEECRVVT